MTFPVINPELRDVPAESLDSRGDKSIILLNLVYFGHFGTICQKTWGLEAILVRINGCFG